MLFIAFSDFLIFGGTMALEAIQLVKCYEKNRPFLSSVTQWSVFLPVFYPKSANLLHSDTS